MTMNIRAAALVFFLCCSASVSEAMGQGTPGPKSGAPAVIKFDGNMTSILAKLPEVYDVTIGLEIDPKQPSPQVSLYLRDPTIADVLNAIVKSAPRYQWREGSGSIEVLPVEGSSPLLDTMIGSFSVSQADQAEAVNRLMDLSDVQANLRAMSLSRRDSAGTETERKSEKFSINLEGVTMREALSRIASESGGRFWIFRSSADGAISVSNSPR